jgi:hypothetical protein
MRGSTRFPIGRLLSPWRFPSYYRMLRIASLASARLGWRPLCSRSLPESPGAAQVIGAKRADSSGHAVDVLHLFGISMSGRTHLLLDDSIGMAARSCSLWFFVPVKGWCQGTEIAGCCNAVGISRSSRYTLRYHDSYSYVVEGEALKCETVGGVCPRSLRNKKGGNTPRGVPTLSHYICNIRPAGTPMSGATTSISCLCYEEISGS